MTPDTLWSAWNVEASILLPLLCAGCLYVCGVLRLRSRVGRRRGISNGRSIAFAAGIVALLVALVSPLDALGEALLTGHMAQHGLLIAVAPPLLLVGRPGYVLVWSLPDRARRALLRAPLWRAADRRFDALSRPLPAATLHGLALWLWHAPATFDAAVASHVVHAVEHVSFLGTALLFWRAVLDARFERRAASALAASFATLVHSGLLGAIVTLAPQPLYLWYTGRTGLWGLTPLEDQQLAGLLMWVPMGVVYLGACIVLAGRLVAPSRARHARLSLLTVDPRSRVLGPR